MSSDDQTCTNCHNITDTNNVARVPAAQLDLRAETSPDNADFIVSYVELFRQDAAQSLNGNGMLVDNVVVTTELAVEDPVGSGNFVCNQGTPIGGTPPMCEITTPVNAPSPVMRAGDARTSRFFEAFAAGGTHAGWLNDAELKLLTEWLDIGAQYFNDPFAPGVPVN